MSMQRILAGQFSGHRAGDPAAAAEGLTHVFVRDLVVEGNIGVYAHEHGHPQSIRFSVDLMVRLPAGGPRADNLNEVLSYEEVVEGIRALVAEGHVNLVETLAERVAARVLGDRRVASARVRVEKLDVYPGAAVGVEIERHGEMSAVSAPPMLRVLSGS